MRILVVGPLGQVGAAVAAESRRLGHSVSGGYVSRRPAWPENETAVLDKSRPESIGPALDRLSPNVIVDTGALHNVDYCESHPEEAMAINAVGTGALAKAAAQRNIRFLFVSTDFVFDGHDGVPYRESAGPDPLSVYGQSKLDGERATLASSAEVVIVRPSVVYSWIPPPARIATASQKGVNFGSWLIDELAARRSVSIVSDQVASPTFAPDLAQAILALLTVGARGTYHAAGATPLSRYEFARRLARALDFDPELVRETSSASLAQRAKRPINSSLDSTQLSERTGHRMLPISQALDRLRESYRPSDPTKVN